MNYDELIKNRRSIRDYKDQPVSLDMLKEIIKESTLAPSSANSQPWKFVIITDKQMIKRISDESKKNLLSRIGENPEDYIKRYEPALKNEAFNVFYNAPALVIIAGMRSHRMLSVDCALYAAYLMNAAVSRSLGTCWINLGSDIRDRKLLDELGIEEGMDIIAPIVIGYPNNIPPALKREEPAILRIIDRIT
jgi:nitroreductase